MEKKVARATYLIAKTSGAERKGDIAWMMATGRLDSDTEWALMEYLEANNISQALRTLGRGTVFASQVKDSELEEWARKSKINMKKATQILKAS